MEAKAVASTIRIAPRKVRLVLDLIRGKSAGEAIAILKLTNKASSPVIEKLLMSALANAEHNYDMNTDELIVKEAYVGKSIVMKRFHVRGRGRASRIVKPFSHLTIVVQEVSEKGEAA